MYLGVGNQGYQPYHLGNFSGGLAVDPQTDSECDAFDNWEFLRNGWAISRLGAFKHNENTLGTGPILGIGEAQSLSEAAASMFIVAKSGLVWYYCDLNPGVPQRYNGFSVPYDPRNDPVRMELTIDSNNLSRTYFTNPNFDHLVSWDGVNNAEPVAGSPPAQKYLRWFNNRLYCASTSSPTLSFSDKYKPDSWPALNYISLPGRFGQITGLESSVNGLIIFTTRAILLMRGDPPLQFHINEISTRIGCDMPNTISSMGSTTFFMFHGIALELSGGEVKITSDKLRGYEFAITDDLRERCWGVVTPFHYIVGRAGTADFSGAVPADFPTSAAILERTRFSAWSIWSWPAQSLPGQLVPAYPIVYSNHPDGFLFAGGDGSVYVQPFRRMQDRDARTGAYPFTQDAGGVEVTSRWLSRVLVFGDTCLQKQMRGCMIGGTGIHATLALKMFDANQDMEDVTLATDRTLPLQSEGPYINGETGRVTVSAAQLDLQAQHAVLKDVTLAYRALRYTTIRSLT